MVNNSTLSNRRVLKTSLCFCHFERCNLIKNTNYVANNLHIYLAPRVINVCACGTSTNMFERMVIVT